MVEAINKHLIPLAVSIPQTDREVVGGYFIWLTLPSPLKGAVVAQRAKEEENLALAHGEMFEVSPLRRCYGLTAHRYRFPATPIMRARLSAMTLEFASRYELRALGVGSLLTHC
jgi:hypothetical protein